jgi:hypothetical protein
MTALQLTAQPTGHRNAEPRFGPSRIESGIHPRRASRSSAFFSVRPFSPAGTEARELHELVVEQR